MGKLSTIQPLIYAFAYTAPYSTLREITVKFECECAQRIGDDHDNKENIELRTTKICTLTSRSKAITSYKKSKKYFLFLLRSY